MRGLQSLFGLPFNGVYRSLFGATLIGFSAAMVDPVCRQALRSRLIQFTNITSLYRIQDQTPKTIIQSELAQETISVVLVLDVSYSMSFMTPDGSVKLDVLKEASHSLFRTIEGGFKNPSEAYKNVRSGMTVFDGEYVENMSVKMHQGWDKTLAGVKDLKVGDGTNTADAFAAALDSLLKDRSKTYAQNNIIVFMSDGVNTDQADAKRTLRLCRKAKRRGITVYSVAFEAPKAGRTLLMQCASNDNHASECHETHYFDTHNDNELKRAFEEIGRG